MKVLTSILAVLKKNTPIVNSMECSEVEAYVEFDGVE